MIAHYRVPIINNVGNHPGLILRNYAGGEKPGVSVADASEEVSSPVHRLYNVHPPGRDARVVFAFGWTKILWDGVDVVVTTEAVHNLVNWLLLALKSPFRYRLLVMGHIRLGQQNGRLGAWLRKIFVRRADGIIAYTVEGAEQAVAWGVDPAQVAVMDNTLDLNSIEEAKKSVTAEQIAELRRVLGVSGLTLLYTGRTTSTKRPDIAIDAVLDLERRGIDVTLIIVGDSIERASLEKRARGSTRIHFVGAVFDEQELARYFSIADVMFIPGAVGLAVVHGFAYGLPLLTARDAPHGPEMIAAEDGLNAVLVHQCSVPSFVDAIEALVSSPGHVVELKANAAATPLKSPDTMAEAIVRMVYRGSS